MKAEFWVLSAALLFLSACGGGSSSGTSSSTSQVSGSSSSTSGGSSSAAPTLATFINATPGKSFTIGGASSASGSTPTELAKVSITNDTYDGKSVIVESYNHTSDDALAPEKNYSLYSNTELQVLASAQDGKLYTISGFVMDLTKKVGESQTISFKVSGRPDNTLNLVLKFEGVESLTIAGKSMETARLSYVVTSSSDTSKLSGTIWYAAGYGFFSPAKASLPPELFEDDNGTPVSVFVGLFSL